jgi:hypothetical protein
MEMEVGKVYAFCTVMGIRYLIKVWMIGNAKDQNARCSWQILAFDFSAQPDWSSELIGHLVPVSLTQDNFNSVVEWHEVPDEDLPLYVVWPNRYMPFFEEKFKGDTQCIPGKD